MSEFATLMVETLKRARVVMSTKTAEIFSPDGSQSADATTTGFHIVCPLPGEGGHARRIFRYRCLHIGRVSLQHAVRDRRAYAGGSAFAQRFSRVNNGRWLI